MCDPKTNFILNYVRSPCVGSTIFFQVRMESRSSPARPVDRSRPWEWLDSTSRPDLVRHTERLFLLRKWTVGEAGFRSLFQLRVHHGRRNVHGLTSYSDIPFLIGLILSRTRDYFRESYSLAGRKTKTIQHRYIQDLSRKTLVSWKERSVSEQ